MNILIPTDFSETTSSTLMFMKHLISKEECNVMLLNAYEISNSSEDEIIEVNDRLKSNAENKLGLWKEKAGEMLNISKDHIKCLAIHGNLLRVLNRLTMEEKFDLIALSTSNNYTSQGINHSEFAKKIIELVNCPVVVVPN